MSLIKSKVKVVFLGQQSTGKTSILTRFVHDKFQTSLGPTVGIDFMAKTVQVNGHVLRMQFWDTAGQQRFRSLIPNYLKEAAIAFLVFDITNEKSFNNLAEWIDLCHQNMGEKCVTILLANKCDLQDRHVPTEEIQKKATQYGLKYFEVSAKTDQNIKNSLKTACEDLIQLSKKDQKEDLNLSNNDAAEVMNNKGKVTLANKKLGSVSSSQKKQQSGKCC